MKKPLALVFAVVFCAALYGCNTMKGACKGASEGAKKDWDSTCNATQGADGWVQKNLW